MRKYQTTVRVYICSKAGEHHRNRPTLKNHNQSQSNTILNNLSNFANCRDLTKKCFRYQLTLDYLNFANRVENAGNTFLYNLILKFLRSVECSHPQLKILRTILSVSPQDYTYKQLLHVAVRRIYSRHVR